MDREPVGSTALAGAGFSVTFNIESVLAQTGTLELEFRDGTVYQYVGVPRRTYEALLSAESAGGYFNAEIRSTYRGWKVR